MIESHEQIRRIRHDMKNHLNTIFLLYSKGSQEELLDYLHSASDLIGQTEQVISTGNPGFDAVLNMKLNEMKEKGIDCSPALSVPQNMALPFSYTVTILGNLLDNAIQAVLTRMDHTAPAGAEQSNLVNMNHPVITLSVTWQQGNLFLHVSNPCSAETVPQYGIGLRNVEETVKKYSGTMQTTVENGNYVTDIILYSIRGK